MKKLSTIVLLSALSVLLVAGSAMSITLGPNITIPDGVGAGRLVRCAGRPGG